MTATVLVTGVAGYLGARVAASLATVPGIERVIGVDTRVPEFSLGEAEFLRTDVRNPLLGRVVRESGVDTLVHMAAFHSGVTWSARTAEREATVIGTMQLLGLCQGLATLRHVVLASTASVYGASPSSPAIITEQAAVSAHSGGHVRDAIEVESYVRSLVQRRSDVGVSVLRLAHVFGAHTRSAMSSYLRAPVVPVPFGFDARVQVIHEDDAVGALVAAAVGQPVGTVNVAAEGILTLKQILRLTHRPSVPILTTTGRALGAITRWAGVAGIDSEQIDYVMYGRCLDLTRMRELLPFRPSMTTRETIEWYATHTWGVPPCARESASARPILSVVRDDSPGSPRPVEEIG